MSRFDFHGTPDAGMTLAEVLIASAILVVCLTALAGALSGSITQSGMARSRDEAMNLANARLESAARTALYDSVGEILFEQVPVGPCTLSVVPPSGYIVDAATLAGNAVSADAASTAIVYLQRPSSATVRVLDMNGVAIARSDGAASASAVSGSAGTAAFEQLLFGGYTVTVTKADCASEVWMTNRRFLDMDALREMLEAEREEAPKLAAVS